MKKYQIIYADPPWDYKGQKQTGKEKQTTGGAIDQYPTMKLDDMIEEFTPKLEEWCDDDCLLYMWTSSPHMDQAIKLGEAWGFNYATVAFVWFKQKTNPGFYTMSQCELVLVFKKKGGKIPKPRGARNIRQLVSEERREHSRKPDEVRNRIVKMHPTQNKLEMFTRQRFEGWDVFGNQVDKFTESSCTNQIDLIDQIKEITKK